MRWDKGDFRGRAPLAAEQGGRTRAACSTGSRSRAASPGAKARPCSRGGAEIGVVTSGNFSPTLGHGIAFAFLPPDLEPGAAVEVDVRGKPVPATVVTTPFYRA